MKQTELNNKEQPHPQRAQEEHLGFLEQASKSFRINRLQALFDH
jgi:hypothetical protein